SVGVLQRASSPSATGAAEGTAPGVGPPAARMRQITPDLPRDATLRLFSKFWPHRGKPRRPLVKIAPCRNQNDIGRRTTSSTSFWSSTISVRTPLRVFHHWSGSKLE